MYSGFVSLEVTLHGFADSHRYGLSICVPHNSYIEDLAPKEMVCGGAGSEKQSGCECGVFNGWVPLYMSVPHPF